jgi:predicted ATP-grasp superfamily ATP-dependent carboligase
VLAAIAARHRVLGCSATALASLADVPASFARLAARLPDAVPATRRTPPPAPAGWLAKQAGASGGAHVRAADAAVGIGAATYFQERIEGATLSALLVTDGDDCRLCGIARHLRWSADAAVPFRYEGAYALASLPRPLATAALALGTAVAREFGLLGCFGIDFIRRAEGVLALVDINPRPTATLELYSDRARIFAAHCAACAGEGLLYSRPRRRAVAGHLVLYAGAPVTLTGAVAWPAWVADRSPEGTAFLAGEPMCTVRARATTPDALLAALATRCRALRALLGRTGADALPATMNPRLA